MSDRVDRPQVLYRFYGVADDLLYVGISVHAPSRFMQHRDDKPWWAEIARITLEHFPDRASVCAAEVEAIRSESPAYNVVHAGRGAVAPVIVPRQVTDEPVTLLRRGQVVALEVEGTRCPPVGMVEDCTVSTVTLGLYSWLTGYFGYTTRTVRVTDIRAMRVAVPMSEAVKRSIGIVSDGIVWDMDPLAEFQSERTIQVELP